MRLARISSLGACFKIFLNPPLTPPYNSIMQVLAGTTFNKRVKYDSQAIIALHART